MNNSIAIQVSSNMSKSDETDLNLLFTLDILVNMIDMKIN